MTKPPMPKVLLIEDDDQLRDAVREVLEEEGFETFTAANGEYGIQVAREMLPDCIISDVNLPRYDGYRVLNEIRKQPEMAFTPFIFLTAQGDKDDVRRGMTQGADDYITKPFQVADLLSSLRIRLEKSTIIKQRMDELRTNISSMLPHELRTPLAGIMGLAQFLTDPSSLPGDEEVAEMGKLILESSLRLERIVENYLLYSQFKMVSDEANTLSPWRGDQSIIAPKDIELFVRKIIKLNDREDDLELALCPDSLRISGISVQKIVEELVDNACKFSKSGTKISVCSTVEQDRFLLQVQDCGLGMTREQIAMVDGFVQFNRKHYEQQGSGLGLILAKYLVELHKGSFRVINAPEKGTIVIASFPSSVVRKEETLLASSGE